jgi:RNAse (barnase) inhibitor barstar
MLTGGTDRPFTIRWKESGLSKQALGAEFERIVSVFEKVKQKYSHNSIGNEFHYILEDISKV